MSNYFIIFIPFYIIVTDSEKCHNITTKCERYAEKCLLLSLFIYAIIENKAINFYCHFVNIIPRRAEIAL